MVKGDVVWTRTAREQRRAVLKYWTIRNNSTKYSEKLIELLSKRIEIIQKYPESFPMTNYPNTRFSAMGHFSIFFKHIDQQLIITAFWDNRQEPGKLDTLLKS